MWHALIRAEGVNDMWEMSLTEPLGNLATSRSMQPYTGIGSSASADLYFSRTHGTKKDTNVKELKQGASKIADLLQRSSQDEVLEPKPSTASSDEKRLAAGISTIGLQTKKLSGAQKRRLRKKDEGGNLDRKT